ncbi:MAG: glycosyltransferase [Candidatus Micrarchaeota archaeon]|nr:glycosyltransferase [Candidatus Micrarchaeota archaeon]
MKIAMFTDSYLPTTDGVVSSILAFKKGLEEKGHKMYVFAPAPATKFKDSSGVFRFASITFPPYPQYRAAIFPYVASEVAQKTGVQIVHSKAMVTMALSAANFASRARLPSMASLETMIPDGVHYIIKHKGGQQIGKKIAWKYLQWLYSKFDLVTAPSRHAQGIMAQNGIESEVLPSPVDTGFFKPKKNREKAKRELGLAGKKLVLCVGRIVKEKNYSLIVKAAKLIRDRDVFFLIVGTGPYAQELQKEIDQLGVRDRVRMQGFVVDRRKLVDIYNAADVFAFASSFETQGLVHLEAMACGTPACVLEDTAPSEAIKDGLNGYAFSGEPADCAEKLLAAIEKRDRLSPMARKTALRYSIPSLTEKLLEKYRKLLG